MNLPFQNIGDESEIVPAQKLAGRVAGVYIAGGESFETAAGDRLAVDFEGIAGDCHRGYQRPSGVREPWYSRGTVMHNNRQISIVSPDELAIVARNMGIAEIRPQWIGANLAIEGISRLSMLPAGTLLMFEGGVSIRVGGNNAPCRFAGALVAERAGMNDEQAGALAFAKAARWLRGVVGWVEVPGAIKPGEAVSGRVGEQWIYRR